MQILIVGVGAMGARHLQAMARLTEEATIFVAETSSRAREAANVLWREVPGHTRHTIRFIDLEDVPKGEIDVAVLATSASGRLQLLQQIVDAGVTSILTEKILFQSVEEYRVACALVETAKVDVRAHVPYRYVDQIKALKRLHEGEPIHLNVRVGDRGLGCNGVHFIDLFQYLAGSEIISLNTTIDFPLQKNRRDASLVEFSGAVSAKTRSNAILNLEFQKGDDDLSEITVQSGSHKTVIRFDDGSVESTFDELAGSKMEMPMASAMSHFLLQDILARQSLLPSLAEGKSYNILMLESYNRALGRMPDDHCPIT